MNPPLCRGRQLADPLADGTERNVEWGQLTATTPWLPPGGSWIFWQAAFRNRLAKKTDEGWRQVDKCMQLDEWHLLWFPQNNVLLWILLAIATPHQPALPVPKCRQVCQLPPRGKPRGRLRELVPFNELLTSVSFWAAAPLGSPNWRPLQTQKFLTSTIQQGAL